MTTTSTVFTVTKVSNDSFEVLGSYSSEKTAKEAMKAYATENNYKKKVPKKDDTNRCMYASETDKLYVSVNELQSEKPARVQKAKADPNAPKKPLSAYMLFAAENRVAIKQANGDANFSQLGKLIGTAWRGLSDKAKAEYKRKELLDRERYQAQSQTYTQTQSQTQAQA